MQHLEKYPMELEVEVTQDDIDNGVRCSSRNCAFALAVKRIYPDDIVIVRHACLCLSLHNVKDLTDVVYMGNIDVYRFTVDFDNYEEVKPGKFRLKRAE